MTKQIYLTTIFMIFTLFSFQPIKAKTMEGKKATDEQYRQWMWDDISASNFNSAMHKGKEMIDKITPGTRKPFITKFLDDMDKLELDLWKEINKFRQEEWENAQDGYDTTYAKLIKLVDDFIKESVETISP